MSDINIFIGVNSIKFHNGFKDYNDCLVYLLEIKRQVDINANDVVIITSEMVNIFKNRRYATCRDDESPTTGIKCLRSLNFQF